MKDTVYYNQLISKFFDTAKNNQEKIAVREIDREITFSKLYCEVLFLSKKIEQLLKNKRNQRIGIFSKTGYQRLFSGQTKRLSE